MENNDMISVTVKAPADQSVNVRMIDGGEQQNAMVPGGQTQEFFVDDVRWLVIEKHNEARYNADAAAYLSGLVPKPGAKPAEMEPTPRVPRMPSDEGFRSSEE